MLGLHALIGKPIPTEAATEGSPSVDGLKTEQLQPPETVVDLGSSQPVIKGEF